MNFSEKRYETMSYRRCGRSGLKLPPVARLLAQFRRHADHAEARRMLHRAFDIGITHFDFANNYGPPPGSASHSRQVWRRIQGLSGRTHHFVERRVRDVARPLWRMGFTQILIGKPRPISPTARFGLRDVFYSHRPDPDTPLEETIGALDSAVRQGKALYVGISSYDGAMTEAAMKVAQELRTPLVIHQPSYSMLNR